MSSKKDILFLTGTRADFGKLKPLIRAVEDSNDFEAAVFVTGMHMLARYGSTVLEVARERYRNMFTFINHVVGEPMDLALANTITGLSRYVQEFSPDLIVVHGDRIETLAGAIVGALRNVLVAHVEGGEVSGTVDGLIRHSVSKLAHIHFVANEEARARLRQLGEQDESIFVVGSPDIDVMLSPSLPGLAEAKAHYGIGFESFALVMFHPVTTEIALLRAHSEALVDALLESEIPYVVIYPNDDQGCEHILAAYERLRGRPTVRLFPSLRFEYFLAMLKHARFIIGNSSAGVREAPVYALPSINLGTRQLGRFRSDSIIETGFDKAAILGAISQALSMRNLAPCLQFGEGNSAVRVLEALREPRLWRTRLQKPFVDLSSP